MRKIFTVLSILGIMLLAVSGCSSKNVEIAIENKITDLGYDIIEKDEDIVMWEIKTKAEEYKEISMAKFWDIQKIDIGKYEGKTIVYHRYIVKNHPAEHLALDAEAAEISIGTIDNEIVGGYSMPYQEGETFLGGPASLTGESLEEVTGLSYSKWVSEWEKNYDRRQN